MFKVQQLTCEQTLLKRQIKEYETKFAILSAKLSEEKLKYTEETETLSKTLADKIKECEKYKQEIIDQKGENALVKRKYEMSIRVIVKYYSVETTYCILFWKFGYPRTLH